MCETGSSIIKTYSKFVVRLTWSHLFKRWAEIFHCVNVLLLT